MTLAQIEMIALVLPVLLVLELLQVIEGRDDRANGVVHDLGNVVPVDGVDLEDGYI